ncbi:MAG: 50S ribosomal protein L25 [Bacillota bacterium]
MQQVTIAASERGTGKGAARKLRREELIPAVFYGQAEEARPLAVPRRDVTRALQTGGSNVIFQVQLPGGKGQEPAIVKELQRDSLTGRILHLDLYHVSMQEKLTTRVPVVVVGDEAVVKAGGILQQQLHDVEVECLPGDIPEHLILDVSKLGPGSHLTVGALTAPAGVKILSEAGETIVSVVAPRAADEPAAEEKAAEAGQEAVGDTEA